MNFKRLNNIVGWLVFAFATTVYALSAEPTGSLWDCGEFISAAYKLEIVHPPGAPLFLMIGRLFTVVAETLSSNPENIAYAINLLSGISTAFLVLFIFWTTTAFGKMIFVGHHAQEEPSRGAQIAILGGGLVAGLATTFATSVWFSAVEGEVYAMSGFFTGLVVWATMRWYQSTDPKADRWLMFAAYMIGLSIGVHLLSLLTIPFIAMMYYIKDKGENSRTAGMLAAFGVGILCLGLVQYLIIPQLPAVGALFDRIFVNGFGLPFGSGLLFFAILLLAALIGGIYYTHQKRLVTANKIIMAATLVIMGFSTYAFVLIRANANPPINMNNPDNPYSLLSYLNREQYGDRPLFFGPHYKAERDQMNPYSVEGTVWRPVGDSYAEVDEKIVPRYNKNDMTFLPRLGHFTRTQQYDRWLGLDPGEKPTMQDNISFLFRYQIGWMYFRYFFWNFVGRQNAKQGFYSSDPRHGHWISGIKPLDSARLYNQSNLPEAFEEDPGRNTYYALPLLFGLLGLFFMFNQRPKEATALFALFLMTGLAIIVFLNQPPSEPRERDYGFAGSIFTFCIWIGLAVPALYQMFKDRLPSPQLSAGLATALVLIAPVLMGSQNWDDHSRAHHYGARDYAINFLESCEENAILFTHGDNDTYPLWYAQEVEGIRTDVRVVNFSLLAVDWYIEHLRRKVNESDAIPMTISKDGYRGKNRNYLPIIDQAKGQAMPLKDIVKVISEDRPNNEQFASYVPAKRARIDIDPQVAKAAGLVDANKPDSLIARSMEFDLKQGQYLMKDEIALLDIIATNAENGWKRPIYFAATCRPEKVMGLKDYLRVEGIALRVVPEKTPSPDGMVMSMGSIDTDKMFTNMTEKFRWGNFDKYDTFIDESYMPSIQMTQYAFLRLAQDLTRRNDKERAVKTADTFYEAYPHMNFPYDESQIALQMLSVYYTFGEKEKAKKKVMTMANALLDKQDFFATLDQASQQNVFRQDILRNMNMMQGLEQTLANSGDEELKAKIREMFAPYLPAPGQESQQVNPNLLN